MEKLYRVFMVESGSGDEHPLYCPSGHEKGKPQTLKNADHMVTIQDDRCAQMCADQPVDADPFGNMVDPVKHWEGCDLVAYEVGNKENVLFMFELGDWEMLEL